VIVKDRAGREITLSVLAPAPLASDKKCLNVKRREVGQAEAPQVGNEVLLHDLTIAAIGLRGDAPIGVGKPLGKVVADGELTRGYVLPAARLVKKTHAFGLSIFASAVHGVAEPAAFTGRVPAQVDGDTPAVRSTLFDMTVHSPVLGDAVDDCDSPSLSRRREGRNARGYLRFFSSSD